jgi:opacity protein-like surface antigen
MRKLLAVLLVAGPALLGAQAVKAADMPDCCDVPEVDYGLEGSFYLRGSAGLNFLWTNEHVDTAGVSSPATAPGYGYSIGAGFGYEVGNGLRFDGTLDYIANDGLTDGTDHLHLRAGVALANVYYDFPLSGMGGASGGFGAYVGAGIGGAYYTTVVHDNATDSAVAGIPDGGGWSAAASATAGVSYDMGNLVADLGYRMIYLPQLSNNAVAVPSFYINGNTIHEVQATLRYRLQ